MQISGIIGAVGLGVALVLSVTLEQPPRAQSVQDSPQLSQWRQLSQSSRFAVKDYNTGQLAALAKQSKAAAAAEASGDLDGAIGYFETMLAIDPRNPAPFLALARIARAQGLPGKAIAFYRAALMLDSRDSAAIVGLGHALLDRGSLALARAKMSEAKTLCQTQCAHVAALEKAIGEKVLADASKAIPAQAVASHPASD